MDFSHFASGHCLWRPGCSGLRCAVQCRLSGTAMVCRQRGAGVGVAHPSSRGRLEPGGSVLRRCHGSRGRSAIASVAHRNLSQRPSRRRLHSDDSGCVRRQGHFGAVCHCGAHSTATNETLIAAMDNTLRVTFTMGALGTGVAIPTLLLRLRQLKWAGAD